MPATVLGSAAEVLVASGHDPFARGSLRRPLVRAWLGEGAVAWIGTDAEDGTPRLSALGQPPAVAALLTELLPELSARQRVTLPRGTAAHLPAWVGLGPGSADWDFRWLPAPTGRQPGERRVRADVDEVAVKELLGLASPGATTLPGDPRVRRWWGVPDDDGTLLACAADTSAATGVSHLSSVAVHPDQRRRGLGRALVAAVARSAFDAGSDVVSLRLDADDAAGRALCDALALRDEHRFTSGPLVQRGRW